MKTCETCKWWVSPTPGITRRYSEPPLDPDGSCELINGGKNKDVSVEAGDGNGGVWINTGPKFGCVLHEDKTP